MPSSTILVAKGAAVVRPTVVGDLPALLAIANRSILTSAANFSTKPDDLETWVADHRSASGSHPWLTLERDGACVGFARASAFKSRCAYAWSAETSIYLDETAQGRGLGAALYRILLEHLEAQRFRSAIGVVSRPNPASEALHERCGFALHGVLERVGWKLGRWWDVGSWQKTLIAGDDPPEPLLTSADGWRTLTSRRGATT